MEQEKVNVKMKITKQHVILISVIIGMAVLGFALYIIYDTYYKPIYVASFAGLPIGFRGDLREAQDVKVEPSEQALYDMIVKPPLAGNTGSVTIKVEPLKNVTIVFKPVDTQVNGWYSVEATEIVNKLTLLYRAKFNLNLTFDAKPVDSYDGLQGSNDHVIIALVHPQIANETSVKVDQNNDVITISGSRSLKNFDLATTKFLIVALQ